MMKKNYDMSVGEGLTPLLSNALKKKFHVIFFLLVTISIFRIIFMFCPKSA